MDYYGGPRGYGGYGGYGGYSGYGGYGGYGSNSAYTRFAIPGWILIVLGLLCLILGFVDVGWTATRYGDDCDFTQTAFFDPCEANHVYSYISAPIWGGLIMIIAGLIGVLMTPRRLMGDSGILYYIFVAMCMLVMFLAAPAIIITMALELAMNDQTFYNSDVGGSLSTFDETKFAIPIVLALLAGIAFFVAIIAATIACCCRPYYGGYDDYGGDMAIIQPRERVVIRDEPTYDIAPRRSYISEPRVVRESVLVREPVTTRRVVNRVPYRSYNDWDQDFGDYGSYRTYTGAYRDRFRYGYQPRSLPALRY